MTVRLAAAAGTLAAVAAAAAVWNHLPSNTTIYAPFDVRGTMGEPVHGRGMTATITAVHRAPRLAPDSVLTPQPLAAAGEWLVVDAKAEAGAVSDIPHADLVVGPNTYTPTDRLPLGLMLGAPLQPGLSTSGSWVFDIPADLLTGNQPLTLRVWVGDGRLDSRLAVSIDPTSVEAVQTAKLARSETA